MLSIRAFALLLAITQGPCFAQGKNGLTQHHVHENEQRIGSTVSPWCADAQKEKDRYIRDNTSLLMVLGAPFVILPFAIWYFHGRFIKAQRAAHVTFKHPALRN